MANKFILAYISFKNVEMLNGGVVRIKYGQQKYLFKMNSIKRHSIC